MSTGFDPYHRWLSIPPAEQPPTHYRLLGLQPFEANTEVIHNAFKRQSAHVRRFLESPLHAYAQNLLRELIVAEKCLMGREAKAAYDAWLSTRENYAAETRTPAASGPIATSPFDFQPLDAGTEDAMWPGNPIPGSEFFPDARSPTVATRTIPAIASGRRRPRRPTMVSRITFLLLWSAGGAIGLIAGYAILCMIDPGYDFLNVMFADRQVANNSQAAQIADVIGQRSVNRPANDSPPTPRPSQRPPVIKKVGLGASEYARRSLPIPQTGLPDPIESPPRQPPRTRLKVQFPSILPLPSRELTSTPAMFASLPEGINFVSDDSDLQLSLTQGSNLDEGQLQLLAPLTSQEGKRTWKVDWKPAANDSASDVGMFVAADHELHYVWAAEASRLAVCAMRNSLLGIQIGESKHVAALRAPESMSKSTINLTRPRQVLVCSCDDPPELERIQIDVADPSQFPTHRTEGTGSRGQKLGDVTTFWYQSAPGVATRFTTIKRGKYPALDIQTGYRLPSGYESALTITRGKQKMMELQARLVDAQSLKARWPRSKPKTEIDAAIVQIEADIQSLQQIGQLAEQLHNAPVPLRFYFLVAGKEVELAVSD